MVNKACTNSPSYTAIYPDLLKCAGSTHKYRIKNKDIPQNLNLLRKFSISLLKQYNARTSSKRAMSKTILDCYMNHLRFVRFWKIDFRDFLFTFRAVPACHDSSLFDDPSNYCSNLIAYFSILSSFSISPSISIISPSKTFIFS